MASLGTSRVIQSVRKEGPMDPITVLIDAIDLSIEPVDHGFGSNADATDAKAWPFSGH